MSAAEQPKLQKYDLKPLAVGSLGLFTPTKERIVEDSFGAAGETVEAAVRCLQSKLKLFLAGRVLRAIINTDSSQLAVTASVVALAAIKPLMNILFPSDFTAAADASLVVTS